VRVKIVVLIFTLRKILTPTLVGPHSILSRLAERGLPTSPANLF